MARQRYAGKLKARGLCAIRLLLPADAAARLSVARIRKLSLGSSSLNCCLCAESPRPSAGGDSVQVGEATDEPAREDARPTKIQTAS